MGGTSMTYLEREESTPQSLLTRYSTKAQAKDCYVKWQVNLLYKKLMSL